MSSDDIVTQLRAGGRSRPEPLLCDIAAYEIERLRAAGDELDQAIFHVSCGGTQEDMRRLSEAHEGWQEARRER